MDSDRDERLERAILRVIDKRIGQPKRIGREELVDHLRRYFDPTVKDREVRASIEDLRRNDDIGALICSSSGTGGYWLAENITELLASYREERRRALTEMVTIRARLRRGKSVLGGQLKML
jgi:hypothetical protein